MKFTFFPPLRLAVSPATRSLTATCLATLLLALLACAPAARASSSCSNELFRTGPGANLPDCRAYEMVSPPEKNGGEIDGGLTFESVPAPMQAALNGEAVTYASQTAFPTTDPTSSALTTQYLSRRGPEGWQTREITPPQDFPGGVFDKSFGSEEFSPFVGFSEDLEHAFLLATEPSPVSGAPAGYYNPYLRDNADNGYQLLSKVIPPVQPPGPADGAKPGLHIEYAGMSTDGSDVVFSANDALTPNALPGEFGERPAEVDLQRNLYEWRDGKLELISILPQSEGGGAVNARFGSVGTANNVEYSEDGNRVVSRDGSRVIWTRVFPQQPHEPEPLTQLYMTELTTNGLRTVHVSASQRTPVDPAAPRPAIYRTASVDDRYVFFTSCEKLTDDSTAQALTLETHHSECFTSNFEPSQYGEDLYRYDASTDELRDLTVDPQPGQTASVIGVLGASEDGSYVYFVARGALVAGAPSGENIYNIYLWHAGTLKLITSTTGRDYLMDLEVTNGEVLRKSGELLQYGLTRVSPNGGYLAFESTEPLAGYNNVPLRAGTCESIGSIYEPKSIYGNHTQRCIEVYEYDAATGHLICASCNPAGLPPVGNSVVPMPDHLDTLAGWQSTTVQQRYLLDDGRLFFDSTDELVPQASNGGELNVYEYEPASLGSCQREGGCVGLISSGTSNANSLFVDASASGDDIFIVTRQALVAQDGDEALDLYDARANGGFLAPPASPCGGEACRPPVIPAPAIYQAPPSATFVGPGNPVPATQPATTGGTKAKVKTKKAKAKTKTRRSRSRKRGNARHERGKHVAQRSGVHRARRGGLR